MIDDDAPQTDAPAIVFTMPSLRADDGVFVPPTPDMRAEYMYALADAERARSGATKWWSRPLDRLRRRRK